MGGVTSGDGGSFWVVSEGLVAFLDSDATIVAAGSVEEGGGGSDRG